MGRKTKLRDLIGVIKDKVSLSKAAILSKPETLTLNLSVVKATTHDSTNPPTEKHITTLLSFGNGSRAIASTVVEALMNRLHQTGDSTVALKCLITVHIIIKRGSFILQDQLSVYPTFGGRNYLNLSNFRDSTSPSTWVLSSWVRWYANYLETLLSTSRILGFFLGSSSCDLEREKEESEISSLLNKDLLEETESLVSLIEETCKLPDSSNLEGDKLVYEVVEFVGNDCISAINEVSIRIIEFKERLSWLSFGDSVEFVCGLKRLEDCRETLMVLFARKRVTMEVFWGLVGEMKEKIGMVKGYREEGRLGMIGSRRQKVSESARFGDRVVRSADSMSFSSGRLSF